MAKITKGVEIPSEWKKLTVRKKTLVGIREVKPGGEHFSLSWGELDATPEEEQLGG